MKKLGTQNYMTNKLTLRKKGITLIELIVVLAIMGIVTSAIYQVMASGNTEYKRDNDKSNVQQSISLGSDLISKQLRYARQVTILDSVPTSPDPLLNYIYVKNGMVKLYSGGVEKNLFDAQGISCKLKFSRAGNTLIYKLKGTMGASNHSLKSQVMPLNLETSEINGSSIDLDAAIDEATFTNTNTVISFKNNTYSVPNNAPVLTVPIPDKTISGGINISLAGCFYDSDGDPLSYYVTSSDQLIVKASIVESAGNYNIYLDSISNGNSTIEITAQDGKGGIAKDDFLVTVTSVAPVNTPPTYTPVTETSHYLYVNSSINLSMNTFFTDTNLDPLSYTFISNDNPSLVTSALTGGNLVLTSNGTTGTANIVIKADDGRGGAVQGTLIVKVLNIIFNGVTYDVAHNIYTVTKGVTTDFTILIDPGDPGLTLELVTSYGDSNSFNLTYSSGMYHLNSPNGNGKTCRLQISKGTQIIKYIDITTS